VNPARYCRVGLALGVLGLAPMSSAAPAPGATQEIDHLLNFVLNSGCQFYRNGSWYDPRRGEAHLRDKYDYLVKHDEITATEDFIDKAASKSSLSGLAYQVKCGASEPIPSAQWLRQELIRYRAGP
jgi:hypothetical protein